jgi:hypothetical protein
MNVGSRARVWLLTLIWGGWSGWFPVVGWSAEPAPPDKPVLLYSRYYNAEGETRYLPDGTFKEILRKLSEHFTVRIHRERLTASVLDDVSVLLIANPSDQPVGSNPPPPHMTLQDARLLVRYLSQGGGMILTANQENHNLEVQDMNILMVRLGLQFTNLYTDAKQLLIPPETPIVGGLKWGYYTGNLILVRDGYPARPRALITNDLTVKPINGTRDQAGTLLATAEPGFGRVVVITDTGFITDDALSGKGIGEVAIREQDNAEIFLRLARWAGHVPVNGSTGEANQKLLLRLRRSLPRSYISP